MALFVDQPAAADLAHLIDAVGELIAPVLDMNGGPGMGKVAAVDVGDA